MQGPVFIPRGGHHPMRLVFWFPLAAFLLLAWPQTGQAAGQCVACHTDAAKLKALVQAPAETAEEEGSS